MIKSPDPRLVTEQAAMPGHGEAGQTPLVRLLGRCPQQTVRVIPTPPRGNYWHATSFTPPPVKLKASRQARDEYRRKFKEPVLVKRPPYPWRLVMAKQTALPVLLRGFADEQLDTPDQPFPIAKQVLFSPLISKSLFGLPPQEAEQRLKPGKVFTTCVRPSIPPGDRPPQTLPSLNVPVHPLPIPSTGKSQEVRLAHAYYQQWHGEWPVFGGQVVVHLSTQDRRASVTSSYFPIEAQTGFSATISTESAMRLAQQALAGYLDGPEVIGLYRSLLLPWLATPPAGSTTARPWPPTYSYLAKKMIRSLVTFGKEHDHAFSDLKELAAGGQTAKLEQLVRLWTQIARKLDRPEWGANLGEWQTAVVPYAEQSLFVFPFAGGYHLAYWVELLSPDRSQAWRVFVDAETGDVMGRPESLIFHAQHFGNSADALTGVLTPGPALNANPCAAFMQVGIYDPSGDPGQDAEPHWQTQATTGDDFEAVNVAIHARDIYDHLASMCDAQAQLRLQSYTHNGTPESPGLRARVAKPATGTRQLDMGFNSAETQHPKLITFQSGILSADGRDVYNPAYDPDLIYHEVMHGLMWLLNPNPFEHSINSVPFGRAMLEGYANYFARSYSMDRHRDMDSRWARAVYREGQWQDRWAISRPSWQSGADMLSAPNLYPHRQTEGLPVYDVGMVWARALWDLRVLLGSPLTDQLALAAYHFAPGWLANFEMAAEGLLDAAIKSNVYGLDQIGALIFARRGILADQGIQALVCRGNVVLAGADAGLMRSVNDGSDWHSWNDLEGNQRLTNVVALDVDNNGTFYAATETGVYRRRRNDLSWSTVGEWPQDKTPYSLRLVDGKPYVGAGDGVWVFDNNQWVIFNLSESSSFHGLGLGLGCGSLGVETVLYAAGCDALYCRTIRSDEGEGAGAWNDIAVSTADASEAVVTSVAARDDIACVGTITHGICHIKAVRQPQQIASPDKVGQGAVLSLAFQGNDLVAGTTAGLFVGTPPIGTNGQWTWAACPGLPAGAMVIRVLPMDNGDILASTATHGLWRWTSGQWGKVVGVESLTREVATGLPLDPDRLLAGARRLHLFRQEAPGNRSISVNPAGLSVHVYHLDREVKEIPNQNGSYPLPPGFIVVSVENTTAVQTDYTLTLQ